MRQKTFKTDDAKVTAFLDGPDWDSQPTATLGEFTCKSEKSGCEVLTQAITHIQDGRIKHILGPMDGDTWHSYRFVTESDGSPAFLLEPKENLIGKAVFAAMGFKQISGYFSARVSIAETGRAAPQDTDDFTVEAWDGEDPEILFGQVYDLSCTAFSNNAFYKPIERDSFLQMYRPIVPMLRRELIFFARRPNGSLAGFLFGIPNYAEGPRGKSVILKTYASLSRGAGQHLAFAFHNAAARLGYKSAIHALIHDDNLSALRSASEGAQIFRRYGLFGLKLDD